MEHLNQLLTEIGISKVRLAKYLGVSRQMLYNYLAHDEISDWPKEKSMKLFALLGVKTEEELAKLEVDGDYILEVEAKLNETVRELSGRSISDDLKNFNKKEQELLTDIINSLKQNLEDDKSKEIFNAYRYLLIFIQALPNNKEIKYMIAYIAKSLGSVNPLEFAFDEDQQYVFESILFRAMSLYYNGGYSPRKLDDSHKKFVQELEAKKEEKMSRTQENLSSLTQALKELGYTTITTENASEVYDRITEIQYRNKV